MGLLTAGSAVLWLLAGAIRRKLLYFSFTYPFAGMAVLAVLMLAVNLGLVWSAGCFDASSTGLFSLHKGKQIVE